MVTVCVSEVSGSANVPDSDVPSFSFIVDAITLTLTLLGAVLVAILTVTRTFTTATSDGVDR